MARHDHNRKTQGTKITSPDDFKTSIDVFTKILQATGTLVNCGIDVSANSLSVAVIRTDGSIQSRKFGNGSSDHAELIGWLHGQGKSMVRVTIEATGVYSDRLARAIYDAEDIELAEINPRTSSRFAAVLQQSKTDKSDAQMLAQYGISMPFVAWQLAVVQQQGDETRFVLIELYRTPEAAAAYKETVHYAKCAT